MGWRVWTEFSEGNGRLGGLVRVFGKEVLGRCCGSWADDCASDGQWGK